MATMDAQTDDELIRELYLDSRLRVPALIKSYPNDGAEEVVL